MKNNLVSLKIRKRISFQNELSFVFMFSLIIIFLVLLFVLFYATINTNFIHPQDYVVLKLGKTLEFNYRNPISTSFFYIEPIIGKIYITLGNAFFGLSEFVNYKLVHFLILLSILLILFFQIRNLNAKYYEYNLKERKDHNERALPAHYLTIFSLITILGFFLIYFFFSFGNIYNLFIFFSIIEIQYFFLLYLITEDENYAYYSIFFWLIIFLISLLRSFNLLVLMFLSFFLAFLTYLFSQWIRFKVKNLQFSKESKRKTYDFSLKIFQYFLLVLFLIIFIILMYWKTFLYALPYFNLEFFVTFYTVKQNWIYLLLFLILFIFYLLRIHYSKFWFTIYYLFFFSISILFFNFFFDVFILDLIYYYHLSILVGFALLNVFLYEEKEKARNIIFLILFIAFIILMNAKASYSYALESISKNEDVSVLIKELSSFEDILVSKEKSYAIFLKNSSLLQSYDIKEKYFILNSISFYLFNSTNVYYFSDFVIFPYLVIEYVFKYYYKPQEITKIDVILLLDKFMIDYIITDEKLQECFEEIEGKMLKIYDLKKCS